MFFLFILVIERGILNLYMKGYGDWDSGLGVFFLEDGLGVDRKILNILVIKNK